MITLISIYFYLLMLVLIISTLLVFFIFRYTGKKLMFYLSKNKFSNYFWIIFLIVITPFSIYEIKKLNISFNIEYMVVLILTACVFSLLVLSLIKDKENIPINNILSSMGNIMTDKMRKVLLYIIVFLIGLYMAYLMIEFYVAGGFKRKVFIVIVGLFAITAFLNFLEVGGKNKPKTKE